MRDLITEANKYMNNNQQVRLFSKHLFFFWYGTIHFFYRILYICYMLVWVTLFYGTEESFVRDHSEFLFVIIQTNVVIGACDDADISTGQLSTDDQHKQLCPENDEHVWCYHWWSEWRQWPGKGTRSGMILMAWQKFLVFIHFCSEEGDSSCLLIAEWLEVLIVWIIQEVS